MSASTFQPNTFINAVENIDVCFACVHACLSQPVQFGCFLNDSPLICDAHLWFVASATSLGRSFVVLRISFFPPSPLSRPPEQLWEEQKRGHVGCKKRSKPPKRGACNFWLSCGSFSEFIMIISKHVENVTFDEICLGCLSNCKLCPPDWSFTCLPRPKR